MKKAEQKFRIYAILVIFVLLTVLLAVINGVNFTMAAQDADEITQMLAERRGAFDPAETESGKIRPDETNPGESLPGETDPGGAPRGGTKPDGIKPGGAKPGETDPAETKPKERNPGGEIPGETASGEMSPVEMDPGALDPGYAFPGQWEGGFRMGPMGPASPETTSSLRFFTVAFSDESGTGEVIAYHISAISENEALEWAAGLRREEIGWTRGTYRYRVYRDGDSTFVTVIDQGRELLPSLRILVISAVGEALVLAIGWFVLLGIGRKIYAPMEEADRKQKNFIRNANKEFRIPLTVIGGNTELAERRYGPDEQTRSTRRQLARLNELVDKLGTAGIFEEKGAAPAPVSLSETLCAALDREAENFSRRGILLTSEVTPEITVQADPDGMRKLTDELVENALKYALTKASFTLKKENDSLVLEAKNDTDLPDGPADRVFDRFTVLQNGKEGSPGLGLASVKEILKAHNGRGEAFVRDGIFTLRITL